MKRQSNVRIDARKVDRHQITSQGFLVCEAAVTRSGVFDYHDANGRLIREYRSPEEVFAPASLETLKMVPVTFSHPDESITVENVKAHQVGTTGENITHDDQFVTCTLVITDKAVVAYILDRAKTGRDVQLSCGYEAEIEPTAGEHPTEGRYDAVQTHIRYNHVSIVAAGRAGKNVKLKLDQKEEDAVLIKFVRKALKLDGFAMDAIEEEVPKEAGGVLDRLSGKLDEAVSVIKTQAEKIAALQAKQDEAQAKLDTLEEARKKLKQDVEELSDPAGEKVQTIIKDRMALESVAAKLDLKTDALGEKEIKVAVIQKSSPEFTAEGKTDEYINARYDAVVELLDAAEKEGNTQKLADFIQHSKKSDIQEKKDPRAEFMRKSDALADGRKPE